MAIAIYSTATGRLRRIISNSPGETQNNPTLEANHPAFAGETSLRIKNKLDFDGIIAAVATASGKVPINDLYAVVAVNGDVVNLILADPLCGDAVAGHTLVFHNNVRIGWRQMRDGSFQRSLEEIDHDILVQNIKRTTILKVTKTKTQTEADALTAQNKIEAEAALIPLNAEFEARQASR